MLSALIDIVHAAFSVSPHPPRIVILLAGFIAVVGVLYGPIWRITRNFITIAHEGGHALAAIFTGRRLSGIRLHSDTSGLTLSRGRPTGPGMIITGLAGYVTPPLLGLGAASLLTSGRITLVLVICLTLLPLILVMIRNIFGIISIATTMAILLGIAIYTSPKIQSAFGYTFTFFLLLGSTRAVIELHSSRRSHRRGDTTRSDADQVSQLTGVPALIWVGFFLGVALFSLLMGIRWLVW